MGLNRILFYFYRNKDKYSEYSVHVNVVADAVRSSKDSSIMKDHKGQTV